jgi:hypothetical protein
MFLAFYNPPNKKDLLNPPLALFAAANAALA